MASSLLTINMITRMAVRIFKNTNAFLKRVDTQYDDSFAKQGAKIGQSLRVRLPNDYTVTFGAASSVQNTTEQYVTLPLATQAHVDVSFSTAERTLSLDDYSERVLLPKMNDLAGAIANDIMGGSEIGGVCNLVYKAGGTQGFQTPDQFTFLQAKALLMDNSAPDADRTIVNDSWTEARTAAALTGLLNPASQIGEQYKSGSMKNALGFDWIVDQTVIKHTNGTFTSGTVNGANQTGGPGTMTLTVNAITGTFNAGDIVTIDGVYSVNRVTKATTGQLRQFVVTAAANNGATSISIYPGIIPAAAGAPAVNNQAGNAINQQQYQTVTASPANSAAVRLVLPASAVYRKSIAFAPQLVTMATADLEMPGGVYEVARQQYDGISMRSLTQYQVGTDQAVNRTDVIYGYTYVRPEWGCIVADIV